MSRLSVICVLTALACGCFVTVDEGPNRACDDEHPCGRQRVCVENQCIDAPIADAGTDGGLDAGPPDGGSDPCLPRGAAPNLILNPSFETGLTGWKAYQSGSIALSANAYEGAASARSTPGSGSYYGLTDDNALGWLRFDGAGKRFCLAAFLSARPSQTVRMRAREYNNASTLGESAEVQAVADGGWSRASFSLSPRYDGGFLDLEFSATPIDGGQFDVDLVEVWFAD